MELVKVSSCQYNYIYGKQIQLPYSIAMLYTYVKSQKDLGDKFHFEKTCVFRDKVNEDIEECSDSDILLCSCYVWNWEITTHLAREVKKRNPNCLIVFGGPQVPDFTDGFFEKYPFVDILVHGEGEIILKNLLSTYVDDKDWSKVKGISTKTMRTMPEERINDLDELPSPCLTNLIWDIADKESDYQWDCCWETNRGCPYQCTFCDWGMATFTKTRKYLEERLFKEIEWFADNKMRYIHGCDANFGIFLERDLRIAKKLKEVCLEKHYPTKFFVAWAKNTTDQILPIARELRDGGVLGGVTLAVQSLDPETLKIIKRANIKFSKFSDLTTTFRANEIPTYTEVIIGLPGETLESFKHGLEIIGQTKLDTVLIHNCSVLPNAPMNLPDYREKYKIKVINSPMYLGHSSIHKDEILENEEIVVGASSYTFEDLIEMRIYGWVFTTFQNLGVFQEIKNYYEQAHGLTIVSFFETILEYCRTRDSMLADELKIVEKHIRDGFSGKGWDHHAPEFGDITWPIEEASWLRLVPNKMKFTEEVSKFINFLEEKFDYGTSKDITDDLVKLEAFLLTTKDDNMEIKIEEFKFDWKEFFVNTSNELKQSEKKYYYRNLVRETDPITWCYRTLFWGTKQRRYKFNPENLKENESDVGIDANRLIREVKPIEA